MIDKAIKVATSAHADQMDHGGNPYIFHPLRVMLDLQRKGHKPHVLAAAVLHDVVEDTSITAEDIRRWFPYEVYDLVKILTRREKETYKEYIENVALEPEAVEIKLADLRDNMDVDRPTTQFGLYTRHAKAYFRLKFDIHHEEK